MFNIPGFPSAVLIKSDGFGIVILKGEAPLGCIADVEYGVQSLCCRDCVGSMWHLC